MTAGDPPAGICAALAAVMTDVGHVAKRDQNVNQGFSFRGVDAVVNAVGPALRAHGVLVMPVAVTPAYSPVEFSTGRFGTACRLLVTYRFTAPDGSHLETTVAGEAQDYGDKATPKAMSVAFRTALLQALALPTDEPDPDTATYETSSIGQSPPDRAERRPRATREQVTRIVALFDAAGVTDRTERLATTSRLAGRKLASANELTPTEASRVIDALEAAPTTAGGQQA